MVFDIALANFPVKGVDADVGDFDEDFFGAGGWDGDCIEREVGGTAVGVEAICLHCFGHGGICEVG